MRWYTNVQLIGNHFLVRAYEDGKHIEFREEFKPTLFVKSKKESKYRTLSGEIVDAVQPGTVKDCREFLKKYENVDGFEIYGNERYIYQYISDKYSEEEIKFDINKIKLVTIDIEVASENGFPDVESCSEEILAITIQDYATKKIVSWGVKPFTHNRNDLVYHCCESEFALLNTFIQYWMDNTPEIVTGWNLQLYDIPYICKRLNRVLGEKLMKRMSLWGLVSEGEVFINGRKHTTFDIGGVTQLDYMDLYKKFTYKTQESYRLDYIAEVELGQKKLDHSEFDTFKEFYTKNWQKFIEYNIVDVELVDRLEDKMKLIELALTMAFDARVNFTDVFYQVRMWDNIIYNYLKKRNIVIPQKNRSSKNEKYAGAYLQRAQPPINVVLVDDKPLRHRQRQFPTFVRVRLWLLERHGSDVHNVVARQEQELGVDGLRGIVAVNPHPHVRRAARRLFVLEHLAAEANDRVGRGPADLRALGENTPFFREGVAVYGDGGLGDVSGGVEFTDSRYGRLIVAALHDATQLSDCVVRRGFKLPRRRKMGLVVIEGRDAGHLASEGGREGAKRAGERVRACGHRARVVPSSVPTLFMLHVLRVSVPASPA